MFKFNFLPDDTGKEGESSCAAVENPSHTPLRYVETREIKVMEDESASEERIVYAEPVIIHSENSDNTLILYKRTVSDVKFEMAQKDEMSTHNETNGNSMIDIINAKSDLVPAVYEGGIKTWECTFNLICYLDYYIKNIDDLTGKKVLEMGCGSALPAIFCLQNSAAEQVDFQDYNEQVLNSVTIPNIIVNQMLRQKSQDLSSPYLELEFALTTLKDIGNLGRFWAGDWASFSAIQQEYTYDFIISSETIYHQSSYEKITKLLREKLTPITGKAMFACKSIYFGCGGDSYGFTLHVENNSKMLFGDEEFYLNCSKVAQFGTSDSLIREIWLIEWSPVIRNN